MSFKKNTDDSDPSQKGKVEEIVTPTLDTSPRKGRPEEKVCMNPSNPPPKESESETAYQYTAAAVGPNPQHQGSEATLYSINCTGAPTSIPAQLLQKIQREELVSQQPFLDCITPKWHRDLCPFTRRSEVNSNEAH